jgi:hypothetical protein
MDRVQYCKGGEEMSNQWITTGQMVDAIKDSQMAVSEGGIYIKRKPYAFIKCEEDGSYFENVEFKLNDITLGMKWRLIGEVEETVKIKDFRTGEVSNEWAKEYIRRGRP